MRSDTAPVRDGADRRAVLLAGAWAVPVVAAVASAPAASASPVTSLVKPAVRNAYAPQVGSYEAGKIQLNSAQVEYAYGVWGLGGNTSQDDGPQSATFTWRVVVKNTAGEIVATLVPERTATKVKYDNDQVAAQVSGLAPGTYTVVSEIISVTFTPNPINGVTFVNQNVSVASAVTVA